MLGAAGGLGGLGGLMAMAGGGGGGSMQAPSANNPSDFNAKAAQAIPAEVHMFSGKPKPSLDKCLPDVRVSECVRVR